MIESAEPKAPYVIPSVNQDRDFSDLHEYLQILIDYRWLITAVTLAVFIISTVYWSLQPNYYSAQVKILVERVGDQPRAKHELMVPTEDSGEESYYGTQIEILYGRKIASIVNAELGQLGSTYSINVEQIRGSRILRLTVTSGDPQVSSKVANKYAEVYVRESTKEGLYFTQQILKYLPEDSELAKSQDNSNQAQGGFDKAQYAESLTDVADDSAIQKLKSEKLDLESKLSELSTRYKPSHPALIELKEKLEKINEQLNSRMKKILTNVRANLSGEVSVTNVRILEEAQTPGRPSGPDRPFKIFLFTMAGFLVVSAAAVLYELLFQRIRTVKDVHGDIGITFLGYVPLFYNSSHKQKLFMPHQSLGEISLLDLVKRNSVVADSIVSVRTHILFTVPYEQSKRIMITSAIPGEGKTTVATLLSLSLTALGRKIIMIDGDMRRPTSHTYLNIRNDKGLSDYLTGKATKEEVIKNIEGSELKVITAGGRVSNPPELLASERFRDLLEELGQEFDRIVIDVPPVLYIPDALIVAKYVHTGVLICGAGMVQKKIVKTVKEKFDSIGHSLIGIVINRADYEGQKYRYHYYHSYKDYYVKKKAQ